MSRVVLGLPAFNGSAHLAEALESLLQQSYGHFGLVICDDASIDATPEIARSYAAADDRVTVIVNERRLGMVRNWVRVFEEARRLHPDMELFAWVSDHDTWHRRWLEELVTAIDAHPDAVLSYGMAVGTNREGVIVSRSRAFGTVGLTDPYRRATASWEDASAGYLVYGLIRADALAASGVFRLVPEPDRLLITELALRGSFVQVPEVLYFRRREEEKPTRARQRRAFYPQGAPLSVFLPWQIRYAWQLQRAYVLHSVPDVPRRLGARIVWFTLAAGAERELHRYLFRNRHRSAAHRLALRMTARRKRQLSIMQTELSRQEQKPIMRTITGGRRRVTAGRG